MAPHHMLDIVDPLIPNFTVVQFRNTAIPIVNFPLFNPHYAPSACLTKISRNRTITSTFHVTINNKTKRKKDIRTNSPQVTIQFTDKTGNDYQDDHSLHVRTFLKAHRCSRTHKREQKRKKTRPTNAISLMYHRRPGCGQLNSNETIDEQNYRRQRSLQIRRVTLLRFHFSWPIVYTIVLHASDTTEFGQPREIDSLSGLPDVPIQAVRQNPSPKGKPAS